VSTTRAASISLARTATAPFSTTTANARPKKEAGKADGKSHVRAGKKLQLGKFKKEKAVDRGRAPAPGERKAYRKRITLSNDNAIPVPWLTDLTPAALAHAANTGKILALPEETQEQLRASEAFKPTQCWGMFRKPAVLVRKESVELANRMNDSASNNQTMRLVLTGDKVTGKSLMLLQAMTHAFLNNWVVIHIPDGTTSHTSSIFSPPC
jgi:small subunit ribosomal protein S29